MLKVIRKFGANGYGRKRQKNREIITGILSEKLKDKN
jgi:hypothetical protein